MAPARTSPPPAATRKPPAELLAGLPQTEADLPPHSVEAEQAALGAALISGKGLEAVLAVDRGDWYYGPHRTLRDAMAVMHQRGEAVDVLTLTEELRQRVLLDQVGGLPYLTMLAESVPTAAHVEHYLSRVQDAAQRRRLLDHARELLGLARSAETATIAQDVAETRLAGLRHRLRHVGRTPKTAQQILAEVYEERGWVVPGLLTVGLTLCVAKPKIGKSWLALQLCIALAAGGKALGAIDVEQCECLYLALEDTERRLQQRLRKILGEAPCPPGLYLDTQWPRMDAGGRTALLAYLKEHPAVRLVVIDTLERFRAASPAHENAYRDDYAAVADIQAIANATSVAFLVIHHERKAKSEDIFDAVSGSIGVTGAADATLILRRERGQKGAVLHTTGRDIEEKEYGLEWDPHSLWTFRGLAEEYLRTKEQQEIIELLAQRPQGMKPAEIASILGQNHQTIKSKLWRMAERGQLLSEGGAYSLHPSLLVQHYAEKPGTLQPPATAEVAATGATATGGELFGCGVAAVAPVARVAPVADIDPLSVLRLELRALACEQTWPAYTGSDGQSYGGSEAAWERLAREGDADWLRATLAWLREAS